MESLGSGFSIRSAYLTIEIMNQYTGDLGVHVEVVSVENNFLILSNKLAPWQRVPANPALQTQWKESPAPS